MKFFIGGTIRKFSLLYSDTPDHDIWFLVLLGEIDGTFRTQLKYWLIDNDLRNKERLCEK